MASVSRIAKQPERLDEIQSISSPVCTRRGDEGFTAFEFHGPGSSSCLQPRTRKERS